MKRIRRFLLVLGIALLLSISACAASYTFTSMDGVCEVDANGTSHITVTGVVNFSESVSEFTIPLGPNVKDAAAEIYTTSVRKEDGNSILVFEREAGFAGEMNVTWTYTVRDTVKTLDDSQLFTVPLLAAQPGDVAALSFTIKMPKPFTENPVFTSGYYADGIDNYMDISVDNGTITAKVNQALMAGDTLSFSLSTEPGYFAMHNVAQQTVPVDRIILILCWVAAAILWFFKLRYPFPKLDRRSHPPARTNAGVLRCIVAADQPDLALMCACWAASGYVSIRRMQDGTVLVQQRMAMGNERDEYETKIFNALFQKNTSVIAGSKKYRAVERYAMKPVVHFWRQRLFQRKVLNPLWLRGIGLLGGLAGCLWFADTAIPSGSLRLIPVILLTLIGGALCWMIQNGCIQLLHRAYQKPVGLALGSAIILQLSAVFAGTSGAMFATILLQASIGISQACGIKRSKNGVFMLEQALSFRQYLKKLKQNDAQQLQRQSAQYYYQMLPYALALGVGKRYTRAFAGVSLEPCAWYIVENTSAIATPQKFFDSFRDCMTIMHTGPVKKKRKTRPTQSSQRKKSVSANKRTPVPNRNTRADDEYNHEYHRSNDPARRRQQAQHYHQYDGDNVT